MSVRLATTRCKCWNRCSPWLSHRPIFLPSPVHGGRTRMGPGWKPSRGTASRRYWLPLGIRTAALSDAVKANDCGCRFTLAIHCMATRVCNRVLLARMGQFVPSDCFQRTSAMSIVGGGSHYGRTKSRTILVGASVTLGSGATYSPCVVVKRVEGLNANYFDQSSWFTLEWYARDVGLVRRIKRLSTTDSVVVDLIAHYIAR